jgi:hypothetical protein
MGPFRRQLALFIATATPAMAEVCDKTRPGWAPDDGPLGIWGEVLVFVTTPALLVIIIALIAGWYFRQHLLLSAVMLAAVVFAVPQYVPVNPELVAAAQAEGCMGPPTLVIGLLGLIWFCAMAGLFLRRKGVT